MRVRLKLMGVLKPRMPPGGDIDVADGASIEDVLLALDIVPQTVKVFTVNGKFERDRGRVLAADDELTVIPPVAGG